MPLKATTSPASCWSASRARERRCFELPEGIGVGEARRYLRANPAVSYALPNYIATRRRGAQRSRPQRPAPRLAKPAVELPALRIELRAGRPTRSSSKRRGGINALDAWNTIARTGRGSGKGARVAVLDTGIAYQDQEADLQEEPRLRPKQFVAGYDFVKGNALPYDRDGHGTHVTGTIAERTNNGIAATGLAPAAKIIPVRVLDSQGFGQRRATSPAGIRYAARRGADVINMSFEFARRVSSCKQIRGVCKALRFATKQRGALVVSAAGQRRRGGSALAEASFPARAPRVLGVGATTRDGCIADYSNFGLGLDLVGARRRDARRDRLQGRQRARFEPADLPAHLQRTAGCKQFGFPSIYRGTSMATAHVSGVAAMVISSRVLGRNPSRLALECQLKGTARDTSPELGQPYDSHLFGAGLIDAAPRGLRAAHRAVSRPN